MGRTSRAGPTRKAKILGSKAECSLAVCAPPYSLVLLLLVLIESIAQHGTRCPPAAHSAFQTAEKTTVNPALL
ncbi:unnamed protein product [Caenorhabditis auriculariae]|uniref:Uncharacterized protein n=1 Tax=Caenorhabditis auriculariae TaxID=2777116 RepID=A0A8S1GSD7_9PELO|nr:unnamed protein product [Caenorhabditis auriculariae]